jgi:FSR family fosmidomycin resistance protein-like MFS transporter
MSISILAKRASRPAAASRSDTTIAIVASSHLATDILIGAFGATLPHLQERFGLSGPQVAALAAVLAATSSFGQPVAGRLVDRVGPRDLAAGGAVVASTLLALAASTPTFVVLVAVIAAGGLGAAVYHPAAASIARDAAPGNPGLALSLYGAGGTIGLAVGPLLAIVLLDRLGPGHLAWLMLPGIAMAIVLRHRVTGLDQAVRTRRPSRPRSPGLVPRELWPLIASATLVYLASTAFTTAVPLWLDAEGNGQQIGWTLGAYALAAAGGGLLAAALASRMAPGRLLPLTTAAAIAPLVAVVTWAPGTPGWFAAVALAGALTHAGTPVLLAVAQARVPGAVGSASGLLVGLPVGLAAMMFIPLAAAVAPWGQLAPVTVAGLGLLPAAIISRRTLRRTAAPSAATVLAAASCGCGGIPRAAIAA